MDEVADAPSTARLADARVISSTPGRMRLRIKRDRTQPQLLQKVKQRLESRGETRRVEVSATTHSVLLRYDRHARTADDMVGLLRDLGVIVSETAHAVGAEAPELPHGRSKTSENIVDAINDLDRRLAHWTGHNIDLKLAFPLALGGLGVLQLARRGVGLGDVPAYVLIWYAFDSFWKFHNGNDGNEQR